MIHRGYPNLEIENEIIKLYNDGKNVSYISTITNYHNNIILNVLHRNNITIRYGSPKLILSENEVINSYLDLKSIIKVSKIFKCSHSHINKILKKHDINIQPKGRNRIYNLDEDYFKNIDIPEKAYIFGFLTADGCNDNRSICINLNKKDIEILEFIKNQISPDSKIRTLKNNMLGLNIYSKKLCKDLYDLGIIPNKTKIIEFPKIKNEYLSHYIRGCFDGDGCVSTIKQSNKKRESIRFSYVSGSLNFIKSLEEIFRTKCNLKSKKIYKQKSINAYYLNYSSKEEVEKIYNFIYKNSCFHLDRKYQKFENYYNQ